MRTGVARQTRDDHIMDWLVALSLEILDFSNNAFSAEHLSEYHVLAIEMWSRYGGDEELGAVGA